MKKSVGLIEVSSISKGIAILDDIVKRLEVDVLVARSICPGKYMILLQGNTSSVRIAVCIGDELGQKYITKSCIIDNINTHIFSVMKGKIEPENMDALGVIETKNVVSSIIIADIVWDSSDVELIKIKLGNGIGGKGLLAFTGNVSSVKNAIEHCKSKDEVYQTIFNCQIINYPNIITINSI
ncbi:BMC domain-containing protein [Clostridium sp. D2Q-14]|uniref:BMC domain-containing protein n=1 Tax=Anaeromonas gelatinilytica TaxID=2683194 RepID=UPI00193B08AC|nr:BMC domain-containing protein [Anaeromonas gelatinilytica]MBS4534533.1 BMC domain-containing protein [Anaeromonas gelatinilytica]